jgi:hypothetical protein
MAVVKCHLGPAIPGGPIRTPGADIAFGIVDTLFVRAADQPVVHAEARDAVLLEKGENLLEDRLIAAEIGYIGVPLSASRPVALRRPMGRRRPPPSRLG